MDLFHVGLALAATAIAASIIVIFTKRFYLSQVLVLANFFIFVSMTLIRYVDPAAYLETEMHLGCWPILIYHEPWRIYSIFTYMYVHSGFLHVLFNMLFLIFFGLPFEEKVGKGRFAIVYFLSGVGAVFTHTAIFGLHTGLVGASGAIFGILGGFAAMYPRKKVLVPIPLLFIFILRRVRIIYAAVFFVVLEIFYEFFLNDPGDNTAHLGHLGGLFFGIVVAAVITRGRIFGRVEGEEPLDEKAPLKVPDLAPLATTRELREILEKIRGEDEPDVQMAWLEHFISKARCPRCGGHLSMDGLRKGGIACTCGWSLEGQSL